MNKAICLVVVACLILIQVPVTAFAAEGIPSTPGPVLAHEPVTVAIAGQPLSILVRVASVGSPIRNVTLNYSLSKDGSPVSLSMKPTEQGVFMATIPADHFESTPQLWYYIEAVDDADEWAETSWNQVLIKGTRPVATPVVAPVRQPVAPQAQTRQTATSRQSVYKAEPPDERQGVSKGMLVGGAVVGAGIIAAVASSGGGGGGGSPATTSSGGGDASSGTVCTVDDMVGSWSGPSAAIAPGFSLAENGTANFVLPAAGDFESGAWSLSGCLLTLNPPGTNDIYRGSGTVSDDKTRVTINQIEYRKD